MAHATPGQRSVRPERPQQPRASNVLQISDATHYRRQILATSLLQRLTAYKMLRYGVKPILTECWPFWKILSAECCEYSRTEISSSGLTQCMTSLPTKACQLTRHIFLLCPSFVCTTTSPSTTALYHHLCFIKWPPGRL